MNNLTDNELIKNIKEFQCSESFNEILKRHENLFHKTLHGFKEKIEQKNIDKNQIGDDVIYHMYKAILSFKEDKKVKFSTWLANWVKFQCLNIVYKKPLITSLDHNDLNNEEEENFQIKYILDKEKIEENTSYEDYVDLNNIKEIIKNFSDKRITSVFEQRFFQNKYKTWKEIGNSLGLTAQSAIDLFEKGAKIIREELKINS